MHRFCSFILAAILACQPLSTRAAHSGLEHKVKGITGVGEIKQTAPTGRLPFMIHMGGEAEFETDLSEAHTSWCNNEGQIHKYPIDRSWAKWECVPSGAGQFASTSPKVTFTGTPGFTILEVLIRATVRARAHPAVCRQCPRLIADNETQTVKWETTNPQNHLSLFAVGVRAISPERKEILWEPGTLDQPPGEDGNLVVLCNGQVLTTPGYPNDVNTVGSAVLDTTIIPAKNSFAWETVAGGPNYRTPLGQLPGGIACDGSLLIRGTRPTRAGGYMASYFIQVEDKTSSRAIDALADFGIMAAISATAAGTGVGATAWPAILIAVGATGAKMAVSSATPATINKSMIGFRLTAAAAVGSQLHAPEFSCSVYQHYHYLRSGRVRRPAIAFLSEVWRPPNYTITANAALQGVMPYNVADEGTWKSVVPSVRGLMIVKDLRIEMDTRSVSFTEKR